VVLRHLLHENLFRGSCGLVLAAKRLKERIKNLGALPFEQEESVTGEAVTDCIFAGRFFPAALAGPVECWAFSRFAAI
jgi:hypothetical protein